MWRVVWRGLGSKAVLSEGQVPWHLWWGVGHSEQYGRTTVQHQSCHPLSLCQGIPAL